MHVLMGGSGTKFKVGFDPLTSPVNQLMGSNLHEYNLITQVDLRKSIHNHPSTSQRVNLSSDCWSPISYTFFSLQLEVGRFFQISPSFRKRLGKIIILSSTSRDPLKLVHDLSHSFFKSRTRKIYKVPVWTQRCQKMEVCFIFFLSHKQNFKSPLTIW
jgi:hypothetical protein